MASRVILVLTKGGFNIPYFPTDLDICLPLSLKTVKACE